MWLKTKHRVNKGYNVQEHDPITNHVNDMVSFSTVLMRIQ